MKPISFLREYSLEKCNLAVFRPFGVLGCVSSSEGCRNSSCFMENNWLIPSCSHYL